jgi:DNA-3-methyladenine glycosylase
MRRLEADFYLREDVVQVARELLGKALCTRIGGRLTSLTITETEAYRGPGDRASHAYGNRRTRRTEPMFDRGGVAYVYLCYGIHHLFNVVTGPADVPHAVLVRAGTPIEGRDAMLARRGAGTPDRRLLAGPGSLSRALGITTGLTGANLLGSQVWIADQGLDPASSSIEAGPRVGIDYAGEDALLPWRFIARL